MSDKAYVIRLHDTDAIHKLASGLEKSTCDISSLRGVFLLTSDDFFEAGSTVALISADRGDLRESIEVEFNLGRWNATFRLLEDFAIFFENSTEISRNSSISDADYLTQSISII